MFFIALVMNLRDYSFGIHLNAYCVYWAHAEFQMFNLSFLALFLHALLNSIKLQGKFFSFDSASKTCPGMEVCACTHESNISKNGNTHSKEEKKRQFLWYTGGGVSWMSRDAS